jgi:hypothetical protein
MLLEAIFMVRFQVLTEASMKIIAFWDIVPCGLVAVDRRFRGAYCLHHQGGDGGDDNHRPDYEGSTHLRNVGLLQRDYMTLYPRRLLYLFVFMGSLNIINQSISVMVKCFL